MITSTTKAWILHKHWMGDTSVRLTFLTEEDVVKNAIFKGGRTPKKQALIQPFTQVWLSLNIKPDINFVRNIEQDKEPKQLIGKRLFSALYINEIIYYLCKPGAEIEELFLSYSKLLNDLVSTKNQLEIEIYLRKFELLLIKGLGYYFSLDLDANYNEIKNDKYYTFSLEKGLVESTIGFLGADISAFNNKEYTKTSLNFAKKLIRQVLDELLDGKEIRSRKLFVTS